MEDGRVAGAELMRDGRPVTVAARRAVVLAYGGRGSHPCVAPLEHGPFDGVRVIPGDIGTFAGLRTDANARVLDAAGEVIAGLHAVGNDMASVMGGTYPGAGVTIGSAMTFGYIAGLDLGDRSP